MPSGKILSALILTTGSLLVAAPGHAQDGSAAFSVEISGEVAPVCVFSGDAFATAGSAGASQPLAPGDTGLTMIDLSNSADQEIGGYQALCNSEGATITIASLNGFSLRNGAGGANAEIDYALKVAGVPGLSGGISDTTTYVEPTGPGRPSQGRRLSVFVGAPDFLDLTPGLYVDEILISISPNL